VPLQLFDGEDARILVRATFNAAQAATTTAEYFCCRETGVYNAMIGMAIVRVPLNLVTTEKRLRGRDTAAVPYAVKAPS
jgi:hypothetical protein